jgi:tetracycline repressor-like protein
MVLRSTWPAAPGKSRSGRPNRAAAQAATLLAPGADVAQIILGEPTRDRIAERRATTRREILDAAWQLAREQSLAQVTLRDVAQRVGLRAPSLHTHFESKTAIALDWGGLLTARGEQSSPVPRGRRLIGAVSGLRRPAAGPCR